MINEIRRASTLATTGPGTLAFTKQGLDRVLGSDDRGPLVRSDAEPSVPACDDVHRRLLEKAQLHCRTLWLESRRLVYDLETDAVSDPNPGPLAEPPDVCQLLAP
jgi:hypothetical protein